jgi:hypothetical protein
MKFIFFLFLLSCSIPKFSNAQASNDFYIDINHDTIYGDFGHNNNGKITFKASGKKIKLDPARVYRVYDARDDRWYAPSYIQNCIVRIKNSEPKMYMISEQRRQTAKPLFAEVVTDGAIVVYAFVKNSTMSGGPNGFPTTNSSLRVYALKRATNEIVELKKTGPVLFFTVNGTKIKNDQSNFFSDVPGLAEEIAKQPVVKYDYMIECIKRYNEQKKVLGEGKESYGVEIF